MVAKNTSVKMLKAAKTRILVFNSDMSEIMNPVKNVQVLTSPNVTKRPTAAARIAFCRTNAGSDLVSMEGAVVCRSLSIMNGIDSTPTRPAGGFWNCGAAEPWLKS